MFSTIEEYLEALKLELKDADPALLQDALSDAREHLSLALEAARQADPQVGEAEALAGIVEGYGTPEETAAAYVEVERRTAPGLGPVSAQKAAAPLGRFFGIYTDPRAWGGLFYMLIAFVTGIAYFTWAVTGLSLSVSLALFIFGLPLALLFLLSIRGVAWLEGRLVEALLGVRMPRRPMFAPQNVKLLDRIKQLLLDKHTWLSLIYMMLQIVLGIFYFFVLVILFVFSLTGLAIPIVQEYFDIPAITIGGGLFIYLPDWSYPLTVLAGLLLWTVTMHAVKYVGQLHGRYAKALLVTE
ncbi:MAG: sensor domain-containing protein [Chloroflexota bacterium]